MTRNDNGGINDIQTGGMPGHVDALTLANNLPSLCWMANADGWIYWYNARWYEFTGTTFEDMQGWGWQSVHDPAVLPGVMEKWTASIANKEPFDMIFPLRRKDGVYRQFLTRIQPFKDEKGNIVQWFGNNTDITEQKEMSDKLEQLVAERTSELRKVNEKLEEKNRELFRSNEDLQQFAHVASHDLKEPVRKMQVFASKMKRDFNDVLPAAAALYLDKITSAAGRMYEMINSVLSFSSLNANGFGVELIDLNKIIEDIKSDLEVLIDQTEAAVTHTDLPAIEGAPVQLHQMFYNLVNNSIKFSRKGIPPLISISHELVTNDDEQTDTILIKIQDNGIGFEQEDAQHIFKTFSRLHSKDSYDGTGLGLSLCKKIAERHGGSISAEGSPGKGAVFTVSLPLKHNGTNE